MRLKLAEIANCLGIPCPWEDQSVEGASIDSRQVHKGNLFICINGERVDGHDYALAACEKGAAAILASRPVDAPVPVFLVPDTVKAFGRLAACCRKKTSAKVLAITGTAGKTTLKETLKAILQQCGPVTATEKNHNNQVGLPLTILNARSDDKFWLLELGISHVGDMDELGTIARPDLAVILNVGAGHTQGLGERGVAWHKTRLLQYLAPGGAALISADYPDLLKECAGLNIKPFLFSSWDNPAACCRIMANPNHGGLYVLWLNGAICEFDTPFSGIYGAEICAAAVAAANLCGLSDNQIKKGFDRVHLPEGRFNKKIVGKWHIFDDTYNANPLSMSRMVEAVNNYAIKNGLPLIAVLGEMGELGNLSAQKHVELGAQLAKSAINTLFWKGGHFEDVKSGIQEKDGLLTLHGPVKSEEEFREVAGALISQFPQGGVAFFKGSRSNRLERLAVVFISLAQGSQGHVL